MAWTALDQWLEAYKHQHRDILEAEPEFAAWLQEEYQPLAGGWQY